MMQDLQGQRTYIDQASELFPAALREIPLPPKGLYCLGHVDALGECLAIVGSRRATPYGLACAEVFARLSAQNDLTVVSGGALGCDGAAHRSCVDAGGKTIVVCGGGPDWVYPAQHRELFQRVIDSGGVLISEYSWGSHPEPFMFRERNRLIAGLSRATLIVEAGVPSGTFTTADDALEAGREVWAVPGCITSPYSAGANRLIAQGATPIVNEESFLDALFATYGRMHVTTSEQDVMIGECFHGKDRRIIEAVLAQPMGFDDIIALAQQFDQRMSTAAVMALLSRAEELGVISHYYDGTIGPKQGLGRKNHQSSRLVTVSDAPIC